MNIDGSPQQCSMAEFCKNSVDRKGERHAKCGWCRLSPNYTESEGLGLGHHWKPTDGKKKHPVLVAEKKAKSKARSDARSAKRASKNRKIQTLLHKAERAERQTERNIIKATRNSGRVNQDADHVLWNGLLTIDTKLQTNRVHPVVRLEELSKVREDARRAGSTAGALLIRNKNGVGVIVLREEDLPNLGSV